MAMPPRRPRPAGFRPHFTLFILYFGALFIGFALLLILPEMLEAAESLPPGADPREEGAHIAQQIAAPRLAVAFALAAVTLGLAWYYQVLPGIRER